MPSFTQRITNLQQVGAVIEILLTPSAPFLQTLNITQNATKAIKLLAMIDTGASGTVISEGLASKLEINPVGTTLINTPSSTNVYLLSI